MITQALNLNLIPGTVLPRLNVVQYDKGSRTLQFAIFNGNQRFTLTSAMSAKIQGTKPDRLGFEYSATVDTTNNIIVADLTQQMTAIAGEAVVEIVLTRSSGAERIGTLNFVMDIQPAALNDSTVVSDSELPDIIAEATEQMEAAEQSAEDSEAWAVGERGGVPVTSGDDTYHNNSKYYADAAATSASGVETYALKSEGFAVGTQDGTPVASGSPYYHNNAEYYAGQASTSATTATNAADRAQSYSVNTPYIGANGNWWVWNTSQGAYVDTGVDASITVDVADVTMLQPTDTPYVTNTGTNTDPVFHLFLPRGETGSQGPTGPDGAAATIAVGTVQTGAAGSSATVTNSGTSHAAVFDFSIPQGVQGDTGATGNGISSIDKTSTSGLVDTYTVTYTNGNTDTFTVTNGRDGTGSGDMSKSDYDPADAVYNVGGIPAYVTAQIGALDASDSAVAGKYVTAVSEADGVISVTREEADTTPTSGSKKMLTSGGAYTALADKADSSSLATVATTGAYSDLTGTPTLATVATSGDYTDLTNKPTLGTAAAKDSTSSITSGSTDLIESGAVYTALGDKADTSSLATVATTGAYSDLSGTPTLATVATSGSYTDLSNKPTLGTAAAKDSTNAVTQNSTDLVESGAVYTEVSSLNSALTNVKKKDFNSRHFLFVGDSYGDESGEWASLVISYLGLTHATKLCVDGASFRNSDPQYNFLTQIQNYNGDKSLITDIVVCGGLNDSISSDPSDYTATLNGMIAFDAYVKANYPNANVSLGYIGNGNDTAPDISTRVYQARNECRREYYNRAGVLGWSILFNVEYALCSYVGLLGSDGVHPSSDGSSALAIAIAQALKNGMCDVISPKNTLAPAGNVGTVTSGDIKYKMCNDRAKVSSREFTINTYAGTQFTSGISAWIATLSNIRLNEKISFMGYVRLYGAEVDGVATSYYLLLPALIMIYEQKLYISILTTDGTTQHVYRFASAGWLTLADFDYDFDSMIAV